MVRTFALMLSAVFALVLGLELGLRILPVGTASFKDYHLDPDVLSYPPRHRWRVATGWDLRNAQTLQANNEGFAADRDFVPDTRAVALVGDSYVEASMLDARDRPAAQLERKLNDVPVYGMGTPGTALLDYGQRMSWAAQRWGVKRFVLLLERSDVTQSLCGSGNVESRCLDPVTLSLRVERQPGPSRMKRLLRHSALAQYMVGQIRFDGQRFLASIGTRAVPGEKGRSTAKAHAGAPIEAEVKLARERIDAVLAAFADITQKAREGAQWVVVLDGARRPPWLPGVDGRYEREYLMQSLRKMGATVVDMQPIYQSHALKDQRSLEVGPYDGHLNRLGVALLAQAAARHISP
jgi:hypothetical protein